MGKRLAALGAAVAITGGGFAVAAVNPLGVAGAQDQPKAEAPAGQAKAHRSGPLDRALDKLVADGTITQDQADKVTAAVKAQVKDGRAERKDRRTEHRKEIVGVAAEAIGSTPEEVAAGLKDGTSIAEQAEAKGVDRQAVDDAITKVLTARIDAAVKDGKITSERAEKAKANLDKAVDRILDADGKGKGKGEGHKRRGGN